MPDGPVPDQSAPARIRFSPEAQAAWFASLPSMFAAAAALFTDPSGRVLLVKPNYRDHWSLPGGMLEHGEAPHAACKREVAEELGIDVVPGPLLVLGWAGPDGSRPRSIVHFIFDGGVLADGSGIALQADELDAWRFVVPAALAAYLPPIIAARVEAGLQRRADGATTYLPWAQP